MRVRFTVLLLLAFTALVAPSAASADCVHVVGPGESLTSIAAADGISIDSLAAANGLSPTASLLLGSCLTIPPQSGTSGPTPTAAPTADTGTPTGDGDGDSDDQAAPATPVSTPQPAPTGDGDGDSDDTGATATAAATPAAASSYVVQPGDTLTAIASRAGTSVEQLAAANGLNPVAPLLIGTVLQLSGSALPQSSPTTSSAAATSQPVGAAAEGSPVNPPYPTSQMVSPTTVGSIAAANGVPASLADAIAYQESGFNNGLVSSADARGVMQILPGTWSWIQHTLVPGASPLAAASATDNIRGGVLLLRSLLNATGGNAAMAAAGYYQGLPSVEKNGIYPSTQQYVNNVMALQQRFGGG
jgi:LysM repeat protein